MPSVCTPICGDGKNMIGEVCDDGDNGGCASDCKSVSKGYTCSALTERGPSICEEICGDGLQVGSEQCDDHN